MNVGMLTDHGKEDIKQIWTAYHEQKKVASVLDVSLIKFGHFVF